MISPDWALDGKKRKVIAVVAGVRVAERRPGTLTSGRAKSGCCGDPEPCLGLSTACACCAMVASVAWGKAARGVLDDQRLAVR